MSDQVLTGLLAVALVLPLVVSGTAYAVREHHRNDRPARDVMFLVAWLVSAIALLGMALVSEHHFEDKEDIIFAYCVAGMFVVVISLSVLCGPLGRD